MPEEPDPFIELIPELLKANHDAQERFFPLAHGKLMGWATYNFRIPESAREDFAIEIIQKTLSRLNKFDPKAGKFTTWMFAIARNHAIDRSRKRRDGKDPIENAASVDVLDWMEKYYFHQLSEPDEEASATLQRSLALVKTLTAQLCEDDKTLLSLCFGTSLNSTEIAEELKISPEAVRKRKQRILERLQSPGTNGAVAAQAGFPRLKPAA